MSVLLMIPLVQRPHQMLLMLDFTYVVGISTILLVYSYIFLWYFVRLLSLNVTFNYIFWVNLCLLVDQILVLVKIKNKSYPKNNA